MSIIIAIVLGLVQGLTEFLPVSSSGHLVLLENIFHVENSVILFDVVLHLATLVAVVLVYRKTIWELIKNPFCEKMQKLVFATIPTCIIALLFKSFFEQSFDGEYLFIGFLTTAIFLLIAQIVSEKQYQYKSLDFGNAIVIGIFQGFAILPGLSRSGSTITSAIVQGVKREEAAEFSFLLSIPIILASMVYECFKISASTITIPAHCFILGFIFAVISGIFSIKVMLKVIKKAKYWWFISYLVLLSVFLIFNKFVFMWF